jgi:hypothetical protein
MEFEGTHIGCKRQDENQVEKALALFAEKDVNRLNVNKFSSMAKVTCSTINAKHNYI